MAADRTLDLLHGFTQDASVWNGLISRLSPRWTATAVDLPGHRSRAGAHPRDSQELLDLVRLAVGPAPNCETRVLCGYSMGARIALRLAAAEPERWTHVVAISSGPGLKGERERAIRRRADQGIADLLLTQSIVEFSEYWDSLPIWQGDPASVRKERIRMIEGQDAESLAAALASGGQGTLCAFTGWATDRHPELLVLLGTRDKAYRQPAGELARRAGGNIAVISGGHSLPLENPAAIAAELDGFVS